MTVDQLINVAVTALQTSPIGIGAGLATLSFQVTNTGNGPDSFVLNAQPAINGNAFTTIIQTLAVDTNGNGIYNAGVDTVLANGSISPKIAPDASLKIFVLAAPPIGVPDTLRSQISLTATSVAGSGKTGSVLTGKGDNAVTAVVGLSGGTSSAQETVVASIANVILTKTLSITDQYGGTSPISGATVTYTLVVHATGSGTANAVTVADLYPAGTTYRAGTLTLNGKPLTDTSDADQGSATQTGLTVALGNLAGGAPDNTITFQTTIN